LLPSKLAAKGGEEKVPRRSKAVAAPEKLIGARIAELRKRQAMTQAELAAKVSMQQGLLSRYEQGRLRLHGALVAELAKALQVSSDEILGLKELKPNGVLHDRRFVRRLGQIDRLPKRKKQALLMTIDSFLRGESKEK
jgi:transcriptional regulator with XRE-family HTH domain